MTADPLRNIFAAARASPAADVFRERCEARAILFAVGEIDLHGAVDVLQADAERSGLVAEIGQDVVQAIMAAAFHAVRQAAIPDRVPPLPDKLSLYALYEALNDQRRNGCAASTIKAAAYLIQQNDAERFRAWFAKRTRGEQHAIKKHFAQGTDA
jgi:hypothetical protein